MAWEDFEFTPENGLENTTTFPSKPGSGAAARAQFMTILNQIKAFFNGTVKNAIDEHKAESPSLIDNRISIPAGADMNDYQTPGNYRVLDAATAATLLNYPATFGGTLEVWRYTPIFFIQRLTTSTTGVFYQRICASGVWSSWNMAYNTTNITVSTSAPGSALAEGFQHQVY
jgi:hypothetical protein